MIDRHFINIDKWNHFRDCRRFHICKSNVVISKWNQVHRGSGERYDPLFEVSWERRPTLPVEAARGSHGEPSQWGTFVPFSLSVLPLDSIRRSKFQGV